MGQAVSYILKSICGEAEEEKRSNDQNLQISPIIQWVTSFRKGSIGESEEEKRSNEQNLQTSLIIQWVTSLRKGSMGQTVFYFLKSTCGEAEEEKRSNEQWVNSLNCLHFVLFSMALLAIKSNSCSNSKTTSDHISRLVSPPSLLSCIDSSSVNNNNIIQHRFKFYHSSILVVGNIDPSIGSSSTGGTLLHKVFDDTLNDFSRIDSSTDEALLYELYVALSSYAPSTDMSSDQALFHEPFVDHSTDVASIDSSTDEALLYELYVALSSYAPSTDMNSDQALFHEPFVDHSTDVASIDSSTDEALLHHELFVALSSYAPSVDMSSDQVLVHELYTSPSTDIPSINMRNDHALVHEPFVDHSIAVPSLESSTDEELLHELFVAPSSDAPSMDMSSDQALVHELYTIPSTDIPSINMSNDQALVHEPFVDHSIVVPSLELSTVEALLHELFVAPSSYAPSTDMSNNQEFLNEQFVDPSTDVPSIGCSTDEAKLLELTTTPSIVFGSIAQFKVTDLNIQVVENKMQVHPPNNENVKTTKVRSEEEYKEAKPRVGAALPVVIEIRIKHYSSSQKILLVGEGDFSFSACLARAFGSASNIVATSLDSTEFLFANYKKAQSNINKLMSRGAKVFHGVDATEMAYNYSLNHLIFDRIIYNFPLAGFFLDASKKTQLRRNRGLIVKFFENAMELIPEDGEIHIAHKSWGFFLEWNLPLLASNVGLRLTEEVPFDLKDYKGYKTKYGFGGDRNFDCNPSKTYKFGFKTRNTAI